MFQANNALPTILDPATLEEGGGTEETLRRSQANYHQSCQKRVSSVAR